MRLILLIALLGATQMPGAPPATLVPPKPNPKQELGKLLLGGDIYTSLEEMLARELPKRVAPADKWEVKIARDGNDLGAGKFSHVEVHGVNVKAPNGLLIDEGTITLDNLKVDMASGSAQVLGDTRLVGRLSQTAVASLLKGRQVQGWKDLRVAFQADRSPISGKAALGRTKRFGAPMLLFNLPVTVVGQAVPRGTSIDFKADSLAVERLPIPLVLVRELEKHVNPIVDLAALKVVSQITRVAVDGQFLVTEARLDFSKGLPGKKKPAPGAAAGTAAAPGR